MICPACNKLAKKSFGCPGVFVCNCTGILEDIEVLRKVHSSGLKKNLQNVVIKQIYGEGTQPNNLVDLNRFESFWVKFFNKVRIQSRLEVQLKRLSMSRSGKIFHCQYNNHNFVIILNKDNLIPDGTHIHHDYGIGNYETARVDFNIIKDSLIISKILNQSIFVDPPNLYTKMFNDPWLK
jgi:hypothetical protein